MADRRFTIQADPRGANPMKSMTSNNALRDEAQAIAAAAAATTMPERRLSQVFFRRLSMTSRKSSMFPASNQTRPNTYRLEPDSEYRFLPYKLQAKIHEVLVEEMKGQTYNPATANDLVKDISRSAHQLMKNIQLPRYKIIIQTIITQKSNQLTRIASRCLWDTKTDNMLSVEYEANDMIATVNVYGVYFE